MPRPHKRRRVCMAPNCTRFSPENPKAGEKIDMTVDEYEAVRLIDYEGLTQEECAERMEVARTTVQSIYAAARKKIASCLVLSVPLHISGGEYRICDCGPEFCNMCRRERRHGKINSDNENGDD